MLDLSCSLGKATLGASSLGNSSLGDSSLGNSSSGDSSLGDSSSGVSSSGISSLGKAAPGALSSRDSSLGFISFTYATAVPIGAASSNIPSYSVSLILISSVSSAAGLNKFTSKYF